MGKIKQIIIDTDYEDVADQESVHWGTPLSDIWDKIYNKAVKPEESNDCD